MNASRGAKRTARWVLATLVLAMVASPVTQSRPRSDSGVGVAASGNSLQPKFVPGQVFRYQVQFQTMTDTKRTGAVTDPQGPLQTVVTWDAVLRVEVLEAPRTGSGSPSAGSGTIRVRTTYEESAARLQSDTPNPARESIERKYTQLEGRSMEFTLAGDGGVSSIRGLEGILTDPEDVKAAVQWIAQFSAGASGPPPDVVPGEQWSSEQAAESLLLSGFVWRTDSSYLRNEPCRPATPAGAAAASGGESCAVILVRLALVPPQSKKDVTPEEYRRSGLQTSGSWDGSGESLSYISLQTGWIVSMTQTVSEQMDVSISTGPGTVLRYAGTVDTRSLMSLLPPEAAASP